MRSISLKTGRIGCAVMGVALCLACHGPAEAIPADVAEKINAMYPADKAVGYSVGDIRGAITIRKAM